MKRIEVLSHTDIIQVMKNEAKINNLSNGLIGLRHFPVSRMETVLTTGTDRNNQATVYEDDGDCIGWHERPEMVTYLRIVNTLLDVPMCVPKTRKLLPRIDGFEYLSHLSIDRAQLLYDPTNIIRASENEFWFRGNPRDSLLAVITVKQG